MYHTSHQAPGILQCLESVDAHECLCMINPQSMRSMKAEQSSHMDAQIPGHAYPSQVCDHMNKPSSMIYIDHIVFM